MRKTTTIAAATMMFTVFTASRIFSQQISDALRVSRQGLHFNARALSMGNSYSTIGYDFSALSFNPATMALGNKASYSATWNTNAFQSTSNYYGTHSAFTTTSTPAGQIGLTFPVHLKSAQNVMVGFGYTQPKDFDFGYKYEGLNGGSPSFVQALALRGDPTARALGLTYPTYDSSGNYLGDQTILGANMYEKGYLLDDGGLTHFSIGAAVEAAHNVFFGISGTYNTGYYNSDLELSASDLNDFYPAGVQTVPGNLQTDGFAATDYRLVRSKQYRGWDLRFGMMYRLANFIGVSASFKVPSSHKVDEQVFASGMSQFASDQSLVVPETETTSVYHFKPPSQLTIGAMANLWILTGTAEVSYVDYSSMKITSGVGDLPDRTEINKNIKDELSSVLNLNGGVEFRLPFTGLSARAGGIYQPSLYKADPGRFSQKYVTAGVGINSHDFMHFDFGYAYGWRGEFRDEQTGDASIAERTIVSHNILLTMRFTP